MSQKLSFKFQYKTSQGIVWIMCTGRLWWYDVIVCDWYTVRVMTTVRAVYARLLCSVWLLCTSLSAKNCGLISLHSAPARYASASVALSVSRLTSSMSLVLAVSQLTQKSLLTSSNCSHRAPWAARTTCTKFSKNIVEVAFFLGDLNMCRHICKQCNHLLPLCMRDWCIWGRNDSEVCLCVCDIRSSCWICTSSEPLHRRTVSQVKTAPRRRHRCLSLRMLVSSSSKHRHHWDYCSLAKLCQVTITRVVSHVMSPVRLLSTVSLVN